MGIRKGRGDSLRLAQLPRPGAVRALPGLSVGDSAQRFTVLPRGLVQRGVGSAAERPFRPKHPGNLGNLELGILGILGVFLT
eukprot:CAMPEP_0173199100 /NCGR_PEP_ID=MMETSP1141-20130122/17048_1 /TAXON_ID=483371 /ORGANISM="non described non described, Strain CCMP2298" /LENGTH=81 /DNA_ID=CAMNT_0014123953 /DNA_START=298 /DNA_END=546 /DNA_ORIENTATION=+